MVISDYLDRNAIGRGVHGRAVFDVGRIFADAEYVIAKQRLSTRVPTSGGEYYWVSILAPKSYRKFLSYVTGMGSVLL